MLFIVIIIIMKDNDNFNNNYNRNEMILKKRIVGIAGTAPIVSDS